MDFLFNFVHVKIKFTLIKSAVCNELNSSLEVNNA